MQPRWPVEMQRWQRDTGNKDSPCPLQQFLNSDEVLISSTARRIISPQKASIPAQPCLSGRLQPDVKLKNSPLTVTLIKNTSINNFACKIALQEEMPGGFAFLPSIISIFLLSIPLFSPGTWTLSPPMVCNTARFLSSKDFQNNLI